MEKTGILVYTKSRPGNPWRYPQGKRWSWNQDHVIILAEDNAWLATFPSVEILRVVTAGAEAE